MSTTSVPSFPLLKALLLLVYAVPTYYAMSPREIIVGPKYLRQSAFARPESRFSMECRAFVGVLERTIVCGLALAEAAILIMQHLAPASSLYRAIISTLAAEHSATTGVSGLPLGLTRASAAGLLLGLAGALLRVWSQNTLGKLFVWQMVVQKEHTLVTAGPYRFVRHPSYSGQVLVVVGAVALLASSGSLYVEAGMWDGLIGRIVGIGLIGNLVVVAAGLVYRAVAEDRMLREEFGKEWNEWAKRTPYRVVPFVY